MTLATLPQQVAIAIVLRQKLEAARDYLVAVSAAERPPDRQVDLVVHELNSAIAHGHEDSARVVAAGVTCCTGKIFLRTDGALPVNQSGYSCHIPKQAVA